MTTSPARPLPLAERLYRARIERGLTQQRLAAAIVAAGDAEGEQLSLSASAVSRWEAGIFTPALRYRRHLAQVLRVDRHELFVDEPPPGSVTAR